MFYTVIHIKGKMNQGWADWFEEMRVSSIESGRTVLSGVLPDISAVYGILSRLSSLGIILISVTCDEESVSNDTSLEKEDLFAKGFH